MYLACFFTFHYRMMWTSKTSGYSPMYGVLLSVSFPSLSLDLHLPVSPDPSRLLHGEPLPHLKSSLCLPESLYSGTCVQYHHRATVTCRQYRPLCCNPSAQDVPLISAVAWSLRTVQAVSKRCDYKLMRPALCKQTQQKVCNPSQC